MTRAEKLIKDEIFGIFSSGSRIRQIWKLRDFGEERGWDAMALRKK
jgi:hypothetical protein